MWRIAVFIIILFSWLPCSAQVGGLPIDYSSYTGSTLEAALQEINRSDSISISYDPNAAQRIIVREISDEVRSLEDFLDIALEGTGFTWETISGTYVIVPPERLSNPEPFSLSGVVKDKLTGESLPFAGIKVQGTNRSTTANAEGRFTILDLNSDTLSIGVSYIGYEPLIRRIGWNAAQSGKLIIELSPKQKRLPSVVISAQSQDLLEVDENISQLTFNPSQISTLPNLGENDVFSALRRLPGIGGGQDAESGLRIRGGQTDQNLVLFDGISVYQVDHLFGFLSAFNSNVIKNIRVNKGGFDARFGGRSSGVVDITGIDGNKLKPSLQAEATMLSANFLLELPVVKEKASLIFGYRRAYTDVVRTLTYRNMFNNIFNSSLPNTSENNTDVFEGSNLPDYFFSDLNAKFNFKPSEKDGISLSYYQSKDDLKITFEGSLDDLNRITNDETSWGNQGGSIKWSRKWNTKLYTYAIYGVSQYTSELQAEETFLAQTDTFSQRFFEQRVDVNDNTFRLDNNYEINKSTSLEFGWWNTFNRISSQAQDQTQILEDSIVTGISNSFYGQIRKRLNKTELTIGLRATDYSRDDELYPEPRISLNHRISEKLQIKAAYGVYHQMIRRLNQRSLYFSIPETWTLSDESTIPVLRSNHYVLGSTFQIDGWEASLEGYHKDETGVVEFLFPEFGIPTGELDQFAIDGERSVWGVDFLVKRSFDRQNLMFGYNFISSRSRYDGVNQGNYFPSPGVSNHEFSFIYNLEFKRWDFSTGFVLANGVPYTPVLGTFIVTTPNGEEQQFVTIGGINSERVDWYHRLDVSGSYIIPLKKGVLQLGLSVYNVYNNLAVQYIDYFQIPREDSEFYDLGQRNILSLGITPSLFLKLKI